MPGPFPTVCVTVAGFQMSTCNTVVVTNRRRNLIQYNYECGEIFTAVNATWAASCPPTREDERCGPLYEGAACPTAMYPYCNEENGWCGITDAHRDAQSSTAYDFCIAPEARSTKCGPWEKRVLNMLALHGTVSLYIHTHRSVHALGLRGSTPVATVVPSWVLLLFPARMCNGSRRNMHPHSY